MYGSADGLVKSFVCTVISLIIPVVLGTLFLISVFLWAGLLHTVFLAAIFLHTTFLHPVLLWVGLLTAGFLDWFLPHCFLSIYTAAVRFHCYCFCCVFLTFLFLGT